MLLCRERFYSCSSVMCKSGFQGDIRHYIQRQPDFQISIGAEMFLCFFEARFTSSFIYVQPLHTDTVQLLNLAICQLTFLRAPHWFLSRLYILSVSLSRHSPGHSRGRLFSDYRSEFQRNCRSGGKCPLQQPAYSEKRRLFHAEPQKSVSSLLLKNRFMLPNRCHDSV